MVRRGPEHFWWRSDMEASARTVSRWWVLGSDSPVRDHSAPHLIRATVLEMRLDLRFIFFPGPFVDGRIKTWLGHRFQPPVWTVTSKKRPQHSENRRTHDAVWQSWHLSLVAASFYLLIFMRVDFSAFCWFIVSCLKGNATFWPWQAVVAICCSKHNTWDDFYFLSFFSGFFFSQKLRSNYY